MNDCRHEWTETEDGWACAQCGEASATCVVTDLKRGMHPTGSALLICDDCLEYERRVIGETARALGHWRYEKRSLIPALRYDRDRSDAAASDAERPSIRHPRDVLEVMWSWADMWAEGLNITPPPLVTDALAAGLMWAAHHPDESAWEDYRREIRQQRHHARRLAGLLPKRHHGPCVHCGGTVVQDWADREFEPRPDGLSDVVRCTGCGLTWGDRRGWMFTNRTHIRLLPSEYPEQLVTIEEAWMIFPDVPKATWRKWRERDDEVIAEERKMPIRSRDERGRPLYRVGDLAALVERRADDPRSTAST